MRHTGCPRPATRSKSDPSPVYGWRGTFHCTDLPLSHGGNHLQETTHIHWIKSSQLNVTAEEPKRINQRKHTAQEWREQCFTELHVCFIVWIAGFCLHKRTQNYTAIHLCSNHGGLPVLHHQSPESLLAPQVPAAMPPAEAAVEFLDLRAAWWTKASTVNEVLRPVGLGTKTNGPPWANMWGTICWGSGNYLSPIYPCYLRYLGRPAVIKDLWVTFLRRFR